MGPASILKDSWRTRLMIRIRTKQSILIGRGKSWSREVKETQSSQSSSKNNPATSDHRKCPVDLPVG